MTAVRPTASAHVVRAGEGERADFPRLLNRLVLRGERTAGVAIVEHTIRPRALAAPMHTHVREDEYSFVLSGKLGAQIGDEVVEAGPGDLVLKPRGVAHAFWNAGDEETRVLEIISPGGFDGYFVDMAPLLSMHGAPDLDAVAALQERFGLTMDMSSIEPLMREHGLRR